MPRPLFEKLRHKYLETNLQNKVDQVVAMIFRITPDSNTELLFLQRAYSENDHYSGDICFPGGHREKGQSCLTTAIRETFEETQLQLSQRNYIGALEFVFTTRIGRSRVRNSSEKIQLYMGILMFEIQYNASNNIKLDQKQIRCHKWVNLSHFLHGSVENMTTWTYPNRVHSLVKTIPIFPAFRIGMERQLYGLTLYTMMLFLVCVDRLEGVVGVQIDKSFFEAFTKHCVNLQMKSDDPEEAEKARKMYLENRVGFLKSKL